MNLVDLPSSAAWRHHGAREGFESVFVLGLKPGYQLSGHTAAVEDNEAWAVRYSLVLDGGWTTTRAHVWGSSATGDRQVQLVSDGAGHWEIDGITSPELDGCIDVDLESSACTNTIPVHRLQLDVGRSADVPAVYVRAADLRVERLEQSYRRVEDDGDRQRYEYRCPAFEFECQLAYDASGLVVEYPGLATRIL
jgi:uncharacterized protein